MKDCCKTGDERSPGNFTVWFKRLLLIAAVLIVAGVIISEIFFN
ncbi:MAG: hypothetical protein P8Y99_17950 [Calditrichaceae bacterium]